MSLRFPVAEFFQSSGNAAAVFNENLRDEIATFACSIWSQFPGFITENQSPGIAFTRGFMNQMCLPIQPPPLAPDVPFQGGQCVGQRYTVRIRWTQNNGSLYRLLTFDVFGPISRIFGFFEPNFPSNPTGSGQAIGEVDAFTQQGIPMTFTNSGPESGPPDNDPTYEVEPNPPGPDPCGNPSSEYPGGPPNSGDLMTTITIPNPDGLDNQFTLVYNKISDQYNFPMGFKLNGTNVILDSEGITIYGPPQLTEPTSGNDLPPPGADGGNDGVGGSNNTEFPLAGYPVVPDLDVPISVPDLIEYVICNEGVIETITETIKIITSANPYVGVILDILSEIIREICEATTAEATVGLPEYYGIKPGVNRPAIVYLWKEFINDTFQASTYSSTVQHPTQQAIDDIPNLVVPDKTIGPWVTSLTLNDGSRIRATGNTQMESLNNFNFLLNQVESSFIPVDAATRTVVSEYPNLQILTLKLRQIEYYPTGKQAGVSPFIRRVIQP